MTKRIELVIQFALVALLIMTCCGCQVLKDSAPNSWNLTFSQPTHSSANGGGQAVWVGVSGNLPWSKP